MTPNEYSQIAASTAIFPQNPIYIGAYPMLGLVGETGEFLQVVEEVDAATKDDVCKEGGDVLWYVNALALSFALDFTGLLGGTQWHQLYPSDFADSETWQQELRHTVFHLAEKVKKSIRDGSIDKDSFHTHLKRVPRALAALLSPYDITLQQAAEVNAAKLLDRKERGVLQGSGDNR